jgi:phosphoribosylformylglycinamidine synthase
VTHGVIAGVPPDVDLTAERALQRLLVAGVREKLIVSAHDCAEGGVAVTLAECSFETGGIGFAVDLPGISAPDAWRSTSLLFSESASRVVVSVAREDVADLLKRASALGVPALEVGTTGTNRISVSIEGRNVIDIPLTDAEANWHGALEKYFSRKAA